MSAGAIIPTLALATLFSGECVLQRDAEIRIWGSASAGEKVTVALSEQKASSIAQEDGRWEVAIGPLPPGGPHVLEVSTESHEPITSTVWIGDVYLCAGQSNMQWTLSDTLPDADTVEELAKLDQVFLLSVPKEGSDSPRENVSMKWHSSGPTNIHEFSAVSLHFAKHLRSSAAMDGVPIGLIDCSYGGTVAEAWISPQTLEEKLSDEPLSNSFFGWKPASMFNGMVSPLVPLSLKGVLWYQGESNSHDPVQYVRLMETMIGDWRAHFRNPELPFLLVQLPNFIDYFDGGHFTWIREAQEKIAHNVPNAYLSVTIDTSDGFDLHPKAKEEIGRRLALIARRQLLDEMDVVDAAPSPSSIRILNNHVIVEFPEGGGVHYNGGVPSGFMLSEGSGTFHPAHVESVTGGLRVHTDAVPQPKYLRYAWEGNPPVTLYANGGLPVAPFRTDSFSPGGIEIQKLPAPWRVQTSVYTATVSGDGRLVSFKFGLEELFDLANEAVPGAGFSSVWGPVRLLHHRRVSNERLLCEMETGAVEFDFESMGLRLRITNRQAESASFQVPFRKGLSIKDGTEAGHWEVATSTVPLAIEAPPGTTRQDALLVLPVAPGKTEVIQFRAAHRQ